MIYWIISFVIAMALVYILVKYPEIPLGIALAILILVLSSIIHDKLFGG